MKIPVNKTQFFRLWLISLHSRLLATQLHLPQTQASQEFGQSHGADWEVSGVEVWSRIRSDGAPWIPGADLHVCVCTCVWWCVWYIQVCVRVCGV